MSGRRGRSGAAPAGGDVIFAFLRAVNVGGANKVPMAALVELLAERGFPPTAYLLASGNLAVQAPPDAAPSLRTALVEAVAAGFGVRTDAVFRTPAQLAALLRDDPFTPAGWQVVHVSLWDDEPDQEGLEALAAGDYSPDAVHVVAGAAYMAYADSSHASKLSNALVERRLGVPATARNVNTFRRLLARFAPGDRRASRASLLAIEGTGALRS